MSKRLQSIRGMPDILPEKTALWQKVEAAWIILAASYGYKEIRMPLLEMTALFKRSIGEVTDIVEKEMFTFTDRDNESITLRPEGTAGCIRAGIEHGLLYNQIQRLWYMGPMFRYEKPQQGRYRQFTQIGLEAFGLKGPDIDLEQILLMERFFSILNLREHLRLEINTLGSKESRLRYRQALVDYFSRYLHALDEDCLRRLHSNPLRILDSKNPDLAEILSKAPESETFLDLEDRQHFEDFKQGLSDAGIPYVYNPRIVRGLDYYNRTVYEWVTDKLGAQSAVSAGGRYDGLVEELGGKSTPGVGFAMGVERVILLLEAIGNDAHLGIDIYFINMTMAEKEALLASEFLRSACPTLRILRNCGGGDYKAQFKRADKSGASIAVILGEDEMAVDSMSIKFLREDRAQLTLKRNEVGRFLNDYFLAN